MGTGSTLPRENRASGVGTVERVLVSCCIMAMTTRMDGSSGGSWTGEGRLGRVGEHRPGRPPASRAQVGACRCTRPGVLSRLGHGRITGDGEAAIWRAVIRTTARGTGWVGPRPAPERAGEG